MPGSSKDRLFKDFRKESEKNLDYLKAAEGESPWQVGNRRMRVSRAGLCCRGSAQPLLHTSLLCRSVRQVSERRPSCCV